MFLALKEFGHSKLRYGLITAVIVMVSSLVFILSGLANGLASGNSQAIDNISADAFVVASGSEYLLDRSSLPETTAEEIGGLDGIEEATSFGAGALNIFADGSDTVLGISIIGVPPDSPLEPNADSGDGLGSGPENGILIDRSLADEGVSVGDVLTTQNGDIELTVVGTTSGQQYRLAPTAFVSLDTWQEIQAQSGGDPEAVNAIAVTGSDDAINAIPDNVDGTMTGSHTDIVRALPGYVEQEGTLLLIQGFLVVISAGIIAAFFFIITLQKMPELGVIKAIGAKTMFLAKNLIFQIVFLSVIGILVGIAVGCIVDILIGTAVPYALVWNQMALYGGILLVVGVLGALLSLVRIARVDPLDAINNAG